MSCKNSNELLISPPKKNRYRFILKRKELKSRNSLEKLTSRVDSQTLDLCVDLIIYNYLAPQCLNDFNYRLYHNCSKFC